MEHTLPVTSRPVPLTRVMLAGMLCMALLGAGTTLYGPALPYLAAETNQSVAALGVVFALHWFGFFASTVIANPIARRFEMRRGTMLGCVLVGAGALGLAVLPFPLNLGATLLVGLGAGMLEILLNRLVEWLAVDNPAAALTRLHSTWGLGAVVIPLVVTGAVQFGLNWRAASVGLVIFALLNIALIWRWPEFETDHGSPANGRSLPWRSIGIFVAMFVVYVGMETAVGGWATTFFAKLGSGPWLGALATSLFFLTFTFARLLLASATDRLGYGRAVRLGTGLGAAGLLLTFAPQLALLGFGLAGVAFSLVFPTMLAWAARRHPEIRAQIASLSIASAGLGGVIIPYLIGLGVDSFGPSALPLMLIGLALTVWGLSFFERR